MTPNTRPTRNRRLKVSVRDLVLRHMHLRWYLYLLLFTIWGLAYVRLFFDATPRVPVLFNWTPGLRTRWPCCTQAHRRCTRGDFGCLRAFAGGGIRRYPGLAGQPFFKIVRGLPGDTVMSPAARCGSMVSWSGLLHPCLRPPSPIRSPPASFIPAGRYYVQGMSPDLFDSRYRESGLVRVVSR